MAPLQPGFGTDPHQLERFYRQHVEALQRFVARRVADPHLAADLTADIFLAVIERSAGYDPDRGSPVAWLYGIARNVIADAGRRRGRDLRLVSAISGRAVLDAAGAQDPAVMDGAIARIDAERSARLVYQRLDVLPDADRALFEFVVLDGLSIAEAAAVLGLNPVTARVRLHRLRTSMRRVLTDAGERGADPTAAAQPSAASSSTTTAEVNP